MYTALIIAALCLIICVSILGIAFYAKNVAVEERKIRQAELQYGRPKELQEIKEELARQAAIVNKLDAEGLEYVSRRADEIAGKLTDINLNQMLSRK